MKRAAIALCLLMAGCSGAGQPTTTDTVPATAVAPSTTTSTTTEPPPTTTTSTTSTTTTTTTTTSTEVPPATTVAAPGTYDGARLTVHLRFRSDVTDVTSEQLEMEALAILNGAEGWNGAGFEFVADAGSELIVILAEGPQVDELCLPLDTGGIVNCQNGPVVALNADRWRSAFPEWDSTLTAYRIYVVNHEVGHLIGLRHPEERCPTPEKISALMEPQTTNLQGCTGNGIPLDWEIDWAKNRPAVVGPYPDWDGPRPRWPTAPDG